MNRRAFEHLLRVVGFPRGLLTGEEPLYTTFVDDSLVRLSWHPEGVDEGVELRIHGPRRGELIWHQGSGGTADSERYEGTGYERFDAWSDAEGKRRMRWRAWRRKAVLRVIDVGCFLCRTPLAERPGVAFSAGENAVLCSPCFDRVSREWPRPRQHMFGDHACDLCRRSFPDEAPMYEGERKLCPECVESMTTRLPTPWWWPW